MLTIRTKGTKENNITTCRSFRCGFLTDGLCYLTGFVCPEKPGRGISQCHAVCGSCSYCGNYSCMQAKKSPKQMLDSVVTIIGKDYERKYQEVTDHLSKDLVPKQAVISADEIDDWLREDISISDREANHVVETRNVDTAPKTQNGNNSNEVQKTEQLSFFRMHESDVKESSFNSNEYPYAYVDGSFLDGISGYGVVFVDESGTYELKGVADKKYASMRNVSGEIYGAMQAITYARNKGYKKLSIYYDYTGLENWATGKWQANKELTQKYAEYCNRSGVKLNFIKVKSHSGNEMNDRADMLAKMAAGVC